MTDPEEKVGGNPYRIDKSFDFLEHLRYCPASVVKKLDRLRRRILWKGNKERRRYYLVEWEVTQLRKGQGGLGIKNLEIQNSCLLMKWLPRFCDEENSLWKEVTIHKFGQNSPWCSSEVNCTNQTGIWRAIRGLWSKLPENSKIRVGNETPSEIFIARNFNKFGRYISLINVRGRRRAVLIIQELTTNSGWMDIGEKVTRFISSHKRENNLEEYRLSDSNIPYAEVVRNFKWEDRNGKSIETNSTVKSGGIISINDSLINQNGVLKRSLLGAFNADATLSEVRRWSNTNWRQAHGLNIYEMGNGLFLFEFTSKLIAEQVMKGDWIWMKTPIKLRWWNPSIGTYELMNRPKTTWVRTVGLPLHLWSQKIFRLIGEYCGGWAETEEETTLRNHIKWARIKVHGDGSNIPKEVTIENRGVLFTM
ncbi:hypothetical protein MTR67_043060 [Solanum verrucosum]|uniref:DUF4283 domain-containing protein n=1 Tax=Solanum verrucosum TaxID=315347 RepID=A0AAF0UNE9_SOLVR|nr:hypothetical protein MTR67_043060 [Solanum verrucosum]